MLDDATFACFAMTQRTSCACATAARRSACPNAVGTTMRHLPGQYRRGVEGANSDGCPAAWARGAAGDVLAGRDCRRQRSTCPVRSAPDGAESCAALLAQRGTRSAMARDWSWADATRPCSHHSADECGRDRRAAVGGRPRALSPAPHRRPGQAPPECGAGWLQSLEAGRLQGLLAPILRHAGRVRRALWRGPAQLKNDRDHGREHGSNIEIESLSRSAIAWRHFCAGNRGPGQPHRCATRSPAPVAPARSTRPRRRGLSCSAIADRRSGAGPRDAYRRCFNGCSPTTV